MNKDELWRSLRCAGKAQDKAVVETLMLRYRPIAPKPTTGQPSVGDGSNSYGTSKRTKRKYVRVSKNNKNNCRRKGRSEASESENEPKASDDVVTLQLLPEKSDLNDESTPLSSENFDPTVERITAGKPHVIGTWIVVNGGGPADPSAGMRRETVVESWVTVESVTGACDVGGSSSHATGCTDVEILETLDKDTCPWFISDSSNRVMWVNEAYRRTVSCSIDGGEPPVVVVTLVTDGTTPFHEFQSFTCRVRLKYTWQEARYTKTVPCDAWRMEFGGFAWRLDTRAALSLRL
ncbi:PREDICTED: uncharacterized protein LOC104823973 [Tarenaya hassleriana]|uniref:uncharacterized protein LOC104823973 n=1 Tax=Tarenaya hassleriana TaxID=28532 RepID=UPI00053C3F1A|nr:PREDICTED: uncharacterized protein LOC104823973 [Tarenaya hassleriana]